jgi:hypothetical protein
MRARRAAVLLLAALAVLLLLRRRRGVADAATVWFDDGSSVSLPAASPPGSALVELAEAALRAAR